jgi:hypothetical protein
LGNYDRAGTYYKGSLKWFKVLDHFFWIVPAWGFKSRDETFFNGIQAAIIDSGTSLAYLPKKVLKKVMRQVLKGQWYFFDYKV